MISRKKILKRDFKKPFLVSSGSKFNELTINFQNILLKVKLLGIENLTKEENEHFFQAVAKISKYISKSFEYTIMSNYKPKQQNEIIMAAIFYRYSKLIGSTKEAFNQMNQEMFEMAENSIFLAIGLDNYKARNYIWDPEDLIYSNFIKHTITKVFNSLLMDNLRLKEFKLNSINKNSTEKEDENFLSTEDILNSINFKIPIDIKIKIEKYLEGEIDLSELSKNEITYIELIYKKGLKWFYT